MKQTLRPYQKEAVLKCRESMSNHQRVLLQLPTGGGKTTIAAEIIDLAVKRKRTVLFLAHRRELIFQAYERFTGFGLDCSVVLSGDERGDAEKPVQIGSVQTCVRRKKYMASISPDLIIVDEAHHAVAKSYVTILKMYPDAFVTGLSATPYRKDGKGLGSIDGYPIFSSLVKSQSTEELIKMGYLTDCDVWSPGKLDFSKVGKRGGDYKKEEIEEMFLDSDLVRELVDHWQDICSGDLFDTIKRTIVFASGVMHSKQIAKEFNKRGIPAASIDGETKKADRERITSDLASGKLTVVSNCGVLTEGYDCPAVSCVVLARPTKSAALYKQMVGRGLRVYENKLVATIIDYGKNVDEHFWPTHDPEADLSHGTSEEQIRIGWKCPVCETENKPGAKKCVECGYIKGSWTCPKCFYRNMENDAECQKCGEPNPILGRAKKEYEKRKIKKLEKQKFQNKGKKPLKKGRSGRDMIERLTYLDEREDVCREKGKNLWVASYQYEARYGRMPQDDGILYGPRRQQYWRERPKKKKGSGTT